MCEHKGQIELVEMMDHLRELVEFPVCLTLVGGVTSKNYLAKVLDSVEKRGLGNFVKWLGKLEDAEVYGLYRRADLYASMSWHEGFGMPLVEAMTFGLPVLARTGGSIAATLGEGGKLVARGGARAMASAARSMLVDPALRTQVLDGQRRSLARYERPVIVQALERHLRKIGLDITLDHGLVEPQPEIWTVQGPYDTSYSLALVNRELARGLERAGENVAVESRDGPGSYAPSPAFLAGNPDLAAMAARSEAMVHSSVCLRNQYPPFVADMRGDFRILANYAWEESGFPCAWVDEINSTINLITVVSRFVAKVLRDNGVSAPIKVVGNGVDHLKRSTVARPRAGGDKFRFLHISSCFPRKGVDALLAAWVSAFDADCDVELIIKTFPNPHNRVANDLESLRSAYPRHAPIRLIEAEYDAAEMRELYELADCVVCPSRGEGFGLPLAEAAALGAPILTTAYGGQSDFCTPQTAWLCDYSFAPSQSHLDVPGSVWVEPDVGSLARTLAACRNATPESRAQRARAAQDLVLDRYSWDAVAAATRAAEAIVRRQGAAELTPRVGWVSTWGSRCGIAAYSESLTQGFDQESLFIFADRGSALIRADAAFVERCWVQGWDDPLDDLYDSIRAKQLDAVVIQFNFGFFALAALERLLIRLKADGVMVCVCAHSTMDVCKPDKSIKLAEIASTLATLDRILVHSVHDLNRLKAIGLVENVTLFPHGAPEPLSADRQMLRQKIARDDAPVIACFGFLLPHKGLRELISAFGLILKKMPSARLLLLNALYPVEESRNEYEACRAQIAAEGLDDRVTMIVDFLDEETILSWLGAADIVVYPYRDTQESVSGAIRLGLASRTPVARTPLAIFADIAGLTFEFSGDAPKAMAEDLLQLLVDEGRLKDLASRQARWLDGHSWRLLSRRLANLIRGEVRMKRLDAMGFLRDFG